MASKRQKRRQKAKQRKTTLPQQAAAQAQPVGGRKGIDRFYHDNYRTLLIIPFAILLAAIVILAVMEVTTGQIVATGVSIKGGVIITVPTPDQPIDVNQIESVLVSGFPENDLVVREIAEFGTQQAVTIEMAPTPEQEEDLDALESAIISAIEPIVPDVRDNYSIEQIGPSLGRSFFTQTVTALIIAFLFMAIVVFFYFRTLIPSGAVVLAAFSDMVTTLAVISLFDIKLSTAGIAAFLMLIGYSVDTDILLSTRVLKRREGTVYDRIKNAIGTGLLMNITTLAAVIVALIITQSDVIRQIMTILLIGLLVDVINTWIQNAGILRWYAERKGL